MTTQVLQISLPEHDMTLTYNADSEVQRGMWDDLKSGRTYEPGTWQTFTRLLRPGDHVIDVGAHVGTFTCLAASLVGPTGSVTAFEPDKANRRGLVANRVLNGFENICVVPKAVSDTNDRVFFYRCADNDGGHAIYDPGMQMGNAKTRAAPKKSSMQADILDGYRAKRVRLIKIDVEGAECAVLRGAQKMIAESRPAIIAEINAIGLACMGETEDSLRELIRRHGYREFGIQDSSPWYVEVRPEETVQPSYVVDGRTFYVVFNMLFVPNEWPITDYLGDPQSPSASPTE